VVAAVGCGEPLEPCTGDCKQPLVLQAMALRGGQMVDLVDDGEISIMPPLQGGYVVYVGVRAQNVHGETASVNAALRDAVGPQVVALEERPVRLLPDGAGWARPESPYQDLANVAVCSTVAGPEDFDRTAWRLEVRLRDSDGRAATTTVRVRPVCAADDFFGCACACDADPPVSGGNCAKEESDAGVIDAAGADARVDAAGVDAGSDAVGADAL
jgi:hypothetical protein